MRSNYAIIQLEKDKANTVTDPITVTQFYDNHFAEDVADYVYDTNWNEDIMMFMNFLKGRSDKFIINLANFGQFDNIQFFKGFKEEYFGESYSKLQEEIGNMTQQNFADSDWIRRLNTIIEEKDSIYIGNKFGYKTLDEFVRDLDYEEKYYFGSTLGYNI
jgi:hypothetical protein